MKRRIVTIVLMGLVMLFLISGISAGEITTTMGDGIIQRIISNIRFALHEQEMFTVYGREMECSIYPDTKVYLVNTLLHAGRDRYSFDQETVCGSKSFFVNYFRGQPGNDQYLKEIYYKDGKAYVTDGDGQGVMHPNPYVECDAGAYWDKKCYVEVYCCSQGACENDYACAGNQYCNKDAHISQLFSQLGVCKYEEVQVHTTKVYRCLIDGSPDFLKEVASDSINWCSNPDKNNYLIPAGGSSGVCYTEANMPCYVVEVNGNGEENGEENGEGIPAKSIMRLPYNTLQKSLCIADKDCSTGICLSQDYLIDQGYMTKSKAKSTLSSFCSEGNIKTLLNIFAGRLGLAPNVCGWFFDDLDSYITNYGYCITDEEDSNFLRSLAFFKITGDKTTDGAIILGGGILILFILFSRLKGLYGNEKIYIEK